MQLEGAPLAVPGPYKITSEAAFGSPGLHVYRPEALDACPKKDSISGWFYVVDGRVTGEPQRVPDDKAPPVSLYCGV